MQNKDNSMIIRTKRHIRHKRIRARIKGTAKIPRLCVFRSSKHIYAQLIDDEKMKTILSLNDMNVKLPKNQKIEKKDAEEKKENGDKAFLAAKIASAYLVGKSLAHKAIENKIEKAVFDRGGYKFHGRVKALADGARDGGLKF